MKKTTFSILLTLMCFTTEAQVTLIPDSTFENNLISQGIDSDGIVNGQISTADALSITKLDLTKTFYNTGIVSLNGIEDFINIESLLVYYMNNYSGSSNFSTFTKLKKLYFDTNNLTTIDLSYNIELEELTIGNAALDVGLFNRIRKLDLSNNNKLFLVNAYNLVDLEVLNMRNNTAANVNIYLGNELSVPYNVCIEVGDPVAATNGTAPYDKWTIYNSKNGKHYFNSTCSLKTEKFVNENFKIYPNPATNYVSVEQKITDGINLQSLQILDSSGKWIRSVKDNFNQIDVSNLSKGMYLFVIQTDKGNKTEKIIIK